MQRLVLLWLALGVPCLAENWSRWTVPPPVNGIFEVYTDAGDRPARETLARFEQFRHALGYVIGQPQIETRLPMRVFVFDSPKELSAFPPARILEGRENYAILIDARQKTLPAQLQGELAKLLLESNTERMPAAIERGLIRLFSTVEITGIRIALGAPPPPAERNLDWARAHLLATSPEYYGKLRVIASNLRNGVEPEPAYRNAIGKTAAEFDKEAARYLAAGAFPTAPVSSRPMSPERDFREAPVEPAALRLALADLLVDERSRAAYQALLKEKLFVAEAHEGLGLLALRAQQQQSARENFAQAIAAGSKSARAHIEYARLESDPAKAGAALDKAAKLNPKLAEPHAILAERAEGPAKIQHWKTAAQLEPRNAAHWEALAEALLAERQFAEAAKAWRAAEQASPEEEQKARMRVARLAIEGQRLDWEDAERKRVAEEKERELRRLKEEARAEVRSLEDRFNRGGGAQPADLPVVPWWDGPKPEGRVEGTLKQVDCIGRQFRLVIEAAGGKTVRLKITDPAKISLIGAGDLALPCGPQKPRKVMAEFVPKSDPKLSTTGDLATLEFR
jgi:hypothetical protein